MTRLLLCYALFFMLWTGSFAPGQDPGFGSTATLDWIQNAGRAPQATASVVPVDRNLDEMVVSLADEPVPAFRFRFWPSRTELKPGSAQTHFYRAVVSYNSASRGLSREQNQELDSLQGLEIEQLPRDAAAPWIDRFSLVLAELEALAMSEDQHWDLRFRDLRGKEIWNLRLEEVQQARSLARLLRMKIAVQIADRDYDGFARSMQTGFRLSAFVGQGESLVQCLVGVAIENILYEALPLAIRSPDAPNFYWALRTLPPELNELREAVEVELSMAPRTFPILDETEIVRLSDAELVRRVNQDMSDLHELSRSEASDARPNLLTWMMLAQGSGAKQKLAERGLSAETLAPLTDLQGALILASRELRECSDQILKASKVSGSQGLELGRQLASELDEWMKEHRTSLSGAIATLLFPAVAQAQEASVRTQMIRRRLMVVEALRMFAADHHGQLPPSLAELKGTPVDFDPFSDAPFGYRVEALPEGQRVILTSQVPERFAMFREFAFRFPAARR